MKSIPAASKTITHASASQFKRHRFRCLLFVTTKSNHAAGVTGDFLPDRDADIVTPGQTDVIQGLT